ncbi:hypothetical protein ABPG72_011776 [Tetrahymena utriculariae]
MSFQTDLYMACPCHEDSIPENCQKPCYWYHKCVFNITKVNQQVDNYLKLTCPACKKSNSIKEYRYYCEKFSEYMPYKNNSPQASIILAQQLANNKLTLEQRNFIQVLLLSMMS